MNKKKIWFDLVAAPDVPFFTSLVRSLPLHRWEVVITARRCLEVPYLIEKYKLSDVYFIDSFYGISKLAKVFSLFLRSILLFKFGLFKKINLGFSFGSRSHTIACFFLRIRNGIMYDYEGSEIRMLNIFSDFVLVPCQIPDDFLRSRYLKLSKKINYSELKESIYAYDFMPDTEELIKQNLPLDKIIIVLRMSSVYAHYHNHDSNILDYKIIKYLVAQPNVALVILPRYTHQLHEIQDITKKYTNIYLLDKYVNGQNLIWHADGVISGGGSMIRESVCLGVPSYDIFTGSMSRLEEHLIDFGKVVKIDDEDDFKKIALKKAPLSDKKKLYPNSLLIFLIHELEKQIKSI